VAIDSCFLPDVVFAFPFALFESVDDDVRLAGSSRSTQI
jgi:hypothetical protein